MRIEKKGFPKKVNFHHLQKKLWFSKDDIFWKISYIYIFFFLWRLNSRNSNFIEFKFKVFGLWCYWTSFTRYFNRVSTNDTETVHDRQWLQSLFFKHAGQTEKTLFQNDTFKANHRYPVLNDIFPRVFWQGQLVAFVIWYIYQDHND